MRRRRRRRRVRLHAGYFAQMLDARAVDCLQADATRCGGYTGWLLAAHLAGAHQLQVSAHCAPNIHAPVAGAVTNLRHVEYFHDHHRIETTLFDGALSPRRRRADPAAMWSATGSVCGRPMQPGTAWPDVVWLGLQSRSSFFDIRG